MLCFDGSIWMIPQAVDMRQGIEGLSHYLIRTLGHNPCQGEAFLFRNKTNTRVKVLIWDGNGIWLCHRQLHRGRFTWAKDDDRSFTLTKSQWQWLVMGADWRRVEAKPHPDWQP